MAGNNQQKVFLAVDLGASGGRVVAGLFDGERLSLEEVHRFENGGVFLAGRMVWDFVGLWTRIQQGLQAAAAKYGEGVVSVGVDTWGVDFGLLGRHDELLGIPYHYRDRRTAGIYDRAFPIVSRDEIFAQTGLQFMELNTLFQLVAMKLQDSPLLDNAQRLLMMPDLFHWLMTGEKANEYTDVSTTQMYNPLTKDWARPMLEKFGIPTHILGKIVPPGTRLGPLQASVAEATGLRGVQVVLPGSHDTASAVMAVPAASVSGSQPDWCYISSGTWSLMGVESPVPVVNDKCRELNFTNEGGVGDTIRLLKNIAGLWLVQECRRVWKQEGRDFGWEELVRRAGEAKPLVSLVAPDDSSFVAPKDMPAAIREYCQRTGQPVPQTEGEVIRSVLESLALRYRMVLGWLEDLTGQQLQTIHIVGGGTQNRLLCQMAADACNRRVVAGPIEATAIGNVMMQAVSSGDVASIAQAREVIRRSFDVEEYTPDNPQPWHDAYGRFAQLAS
ncbi:MAG: FGGY-family carbohydrate kinase [Planctomycetota bacterium]|nr:FGGY-family carbohydrate kinase [Planctomycetota bacterium]